MFHSLISVLHPWTASGSCKRINQAFWITATVLGIIITGALSLSHTQVIVIPPAFLMPCILLYLYELKLVHHISSSCDSDLKSPDWSPTKCWKCHAGWLWFCSGVLQWDSLSVIVSSWYCGMLWQVHNFYVYIFLTMNKTRSVLIKSITLWCIICKHWSVFWSWSWTKQQHWLN